MERHLHREVHRPDRELTLPRGSIDLHCHTTASDGVLPPSEVVRNARDAGVAVLAITDHDTVDGVAEAADEGRRVGVRIVPGIEISARLGEREIHVLGHFVDPSHPDLLRALEAFRLSRIERAERMVERLRAHGADLPLDEVLGGSEADGRPHGRGQAAASSSAEALGRSNGDAQGARTRAHAGTVGRPHIARLLVARGHARDFREAFDRWLGKGKPGWVERPMPPAAEAIELIRRAGGAASLAHPALSKVSGEELVALARAGLSGVEVDHPHQAGDVRATWRLAARSLGLLATAGSDFHGGEGAPGQESMDVEAFERYEATAAGGRPGSRPG